jgi:carbamoyl-phosphate synthase large subunit
MKTIKILFLGAGKRLSLLEQFILASKNEGVDIKLYAAEITKQVPISEVATIIESPKFADLAFDDWLIQLVRREQINIVIPNMDSATVALSSLKSKLQSMGIWAIVSSHDLCTIMEDKMLADSWFKERNIPVPGSASWPRIFKPRKGFGGKSQFIVSNAIERSELLRKIKISDFIEQEYIVGPEYSVDVYVSQKGAFIAAMPRLRLKVLDGEVDESLSAEIPEIDSLSRKIIASTNGWEGPLTLQFIDTKEGPLLIEINPRFGGGVTHSIYCGLKMPQWILREYLGRDLPKEPAWVRGSLMTRCRRDIFL